MTPFARLAVLALVACAQAQYSEERAPRYIASESKQASTPVPILKQINRHNEDGSYTYGYEAADGSFKIETKSPSGEVKGKYGYKDDTGKVRVIEYGANKYGFQPAGEGITVAPPTLVDETTREEGLRPSKSQASRSQYQAAPAQAIDYDYNDEPAPAPPRPAPRPQPQYSPAPASQPQYTRAPAPQPQYSRAPAPRPQNNWPPSRKSLNLVPSPTPQNQYRPAPQQQSSQVQGPTPPKPAFFTGASPAPAQDNFFSPEPQRRQYQDSSPPQFQQFSQPKPQNDYYQEYLNLAPRKPHSQGTFNQPSMLDQLLKEYALPPNGAPALHDISFGSF